MGFLTGSYKEGNTQGSDWASSVSGGNFHTYNNYDPYVTAYTQNLTQKAQQVGNTPYTPFGGGVTGNAQEQQLSNSIGNNALQNNAAFYQTNVGNPTTTAGQLAGTDLSPYLNPYENQVVDRVTQDIDRTRQIQNQNGVGSAVGAGAYGGSAAALLQAQNNRNAGDTTASQVANLRYQGFTNAQDRATADIDRRLASDVGNANRGLAAMQGNQQAAIAAAGIRNQAGANLLNQSNINNAFNYNEFLRQQNSPYFNVNFMRDAITGLPLNTTNFGDTQNATNRFGGNEGSSSGWGVNGGVSVAGGGKG